MFPYCCCCSLLGSRLKPIDIVRVWLRLDMGLGACESEYYAESTLNKMKNVLDRIKYIRTTERPKRMLTEFTFRSEWNVKWSTSYTSDLNEMVNKHFIYRQFTFIYSAYSWRVLVFLFYFFLHFFRCLDFFFASWREAVSYQCDCFCISASTVSGKVSSFCFYLCSFCVDLRLM